MLRRVLHRDRLLCGYQALALPLVGLPVQLLDDLRGQVASQCTVATASATPTFGNLVTDLLLNRPGMKEASRQILRVCPTLNFHFALWTVSVNYPPALGRRLDPAELKRTLLTVTLSRSRYSVRCPWTIQDFVRGSYSLVAHSRE
jgi:hypothetical protein